MKMKALSFLSGAIALTLAVSPMIPSFTQDAVAEPGRGGGGRRGMMMEQLNLTDAQKEQMRRIRESSRQQMDAILTDTQRQQMATARQNRQRPNLNLTDDQKAKMKGVRENAQRQMQAVLTDQQRQQLESLRQQRRQNRQQGRQQQQQQPN